MKRKYLFMLAFTLILSACSTDQTIRTGTLSDRLSPCPDSPNCVSSLSEDRPHHVAPLTYSATFEEAREKLISVISSMKRSKIATSESNYLQVTFTSSLFRFVDDVEFLFDDERKRIDVRSASRTGYYDFNVNRRRVEEIRKRFMAQ